MPGPVAPQDGPAVTWNGMALLGMVCGLVYYAVTTVCHHAIAAAQLSFILRLSALT